MVPSFFTTCKKKKNHFHKIHHKIFILKKINNQLFNVKTMKNPPFIKHIPCPHLNMLACSTSSFIDIFNLLFFHIKETILGNKILVRNSQNLPSATSIEM